MREACSASLVRLCGMQYLNSVQPLRPLRQLQEINGAMEYGQRCSWRSASTCPELTAIRGCFGLGPRCACACQRDKILEVNVVNEAAHKDRERRRPGHLAAPGQAGTQPVTLPGHPRFCSQLQRQIPSLQIPPGPAEAGPHSALALEPGQPGAQHTTGHLGSRSGR